jgi:hypothetical protein
MKLKPLFASLAAVLALSVSCTHGEQSECAKYVAMLGGQNPFSVFKSIREFRCQDALDPLAEMLDPEKGTRNVDVLRLVMDLWDPPVSDPRFKAQAEKFEAKKPLYKKILVKALKSPDTAVLAASAVTDWEMKDLRTDLIAMVKEDLARPAPQFIEAYRNALTVIVLTDPEPTEEAMFVQLLSTVHDVPDYIEVNRMAADSLGKLRAKSPEAIKALVKGLFVVSKSGENIVPNAIEALLKVGTPVVPYLVDIVTAKPGDEKVRYMEEFAIPNGISDWRWRRGDRIPLVLSRLRDERAALPLLQDMVRPMVQPAGLSQALVEDWTITQTNRIKFEQAALMSIGSGPEFYQIALRAMRDPQAPVEARLDLALALAFKATPEAMDTLFGVIFEEEAGEETEGDAASEAAKVKKEEANAIEGNEDVAAMPPTATQSDFVINFMLPLAFSMDFSGLDLFDRIFEADFDEIFAETEGADAILDRLKKEDMELMLKLIRACGTSYENWVAAMKGQRVVNKDADAEFDPTKITDKFYIFQARTKAALKLSTSGVTDKKKSELAELYLETYKALEYNPDYDDFRRALLLGMERVGKGEGEFLKKLEDAREEFKGRESTESGAKFWNQQLDALIYFLRRA